MKLAFRTADHAHPLWVETETLPVPPLSVNDWLSGEIVYLQLTPGAWLTVNVSPAMVSVPLRALGFGLAATE